MILTLFRLFRVKQWYKNIVIFLPLIFGKQLFNFYAFALTVVGFLSLSFVSSANYIINDIIDREQDKKHPTKRLRPIASGKVSPLLGGFLAVLSLCLGVWLASRLSLGFTLFAVGLFLSTQIYTLILKHQAFADIIGIAVNFVIRTLAGAFVISPSLKPYIHISTWLLLCPFFLALFLASAKRHYENLTLNKKSKTHRAVLVSYTQDITRTLLIISTTMLLISFSLYAFFSPYPNIIFTLPFVLFLVFRVFSHILEGVNITKQPRIIYGDAAILISALVITIITFWAIYY